MADSTRGSLPKSKSLSAGKKLTKHMKEPKRPTKYTPSSFMSEMSLTTQERLAITREVYPPKIIELLDITAIGGNTKDFSVDIDQALFQPVPSEIIFQQVTPNTSYQLILTLRNLDRVARNVKAMPIDSPYFSISCSKSLSSKVAPGMEAIYTIQFTPTEDKDYEIELVFMTEREKFIVPVHGLGRRAILDLPDEIHFNGAPVKHNSCKTILVRNLGKKEAHVKLETKKPFSVSMTDSVLPVNGCAQINVEFLPIITGDHTGDMIIHYNTGESVYVSLYGTSVDVNVRLDKSSLMLENTYIGLCSQRTLTLHNRSDIVSRFEWKLMPTADEEEFHKDMLKQQIDEEESSAKQSLLERCIHNPYLRDKVSLLTHSFEEKRTAITDKRLIYYDESFSIDPVEGEIWPHSELEITISFQPEKASSYSSVAYCDVTGRENRLPLRLRGEGLGPKLRFSFDTLDIQNIFVNSAHAYEVILENYGDIEANYNILPSSSLFGPKFSFSPSNGHLLPDGLQAIQVSFSSTILGEFNEEFLWEVEGCNEPLKLKIMGRVIGPTFQFDVKNINYGPVAYGFSSSVNVVLTNTSEVIMNYKLRVPDHNNGAEFIVKPSKGTLPPTMQQNINVTITPYEVKEYLTYLVVDVEEAGKGVYSLPIHAVCNVPQVLLHTGSLHYGRCFISHPYTLNVHLENVSDLPVRYKMINTEESDIECSTSHPEGVIEAHQPLTLPFTIKAKRTGLLSSITSFNIGGSTDPPLQLRLHCTGEGPVVSISSEHLDWGICPVLVPTQKTLVLSNQSEIEAHFETYLMKERTVFSVIPYSSIIPPRQKLTLSITAHLNDSIMFTDRLIISIKGGISYNINLTAEGRGTTVVSVPSLMESRVVELGTHFACSECRKQFRLTNKGRRSQSISWTTEGFSMAKWKRAEQHKNSRDAYDVGDTIKKEDEESLKRPMFQIIPDQAVLIPDDSIDVIITAYSEIAQSVQERLVCHALIGHNPHKERIMTLDISCQFIAPLLQFDTKEISFKMEQEPGGELLKHVQDMSLINVSPLPVTAHFSCSYPFRISLEGQDKFTASQKICLSSGQKSSLSVQYDSSYCANRESRKENQLMEISYDEHPQKDHISLISEIHFPNLHFSTDIVQFGCILNNTEATHLVTLTNNSPLTVNYKWSFIKGPCIKRDPIHDDEGVDMESEIETEESSTASLGFQPTSEGGGASEQDHTSSESQAEGGNSGRVSVKLNTPTFKIDDLPTILSRSLPPSEPSQSPTDQEEEEEEEEKGKKQTSPQPWQSVITPFQQTSIEQVFDILPLYGVLQPGETQDVEVTFFAHTDISTQVTAMCKVEGGPKYQLILSGEASDVQYKFNRKKIYLDTVIYDTVCIEEILLSNIGKVSFDYTVLCNTEGDVLSPGQVSVTPSHGQVNSLEVEKIKIAYFPGTPHSFHKPIQIQVAHFEPDIITLIGEASYPRLTLTISRPIVTTGSSLYGEAMNRLKKTKKPKIRSTYTVTIGDIEKEIEVLYIEQFVNENSLHFTNGIKSIKTKPHLPEYRLDFGYVVYGLVGSRKVILNNPGPFPITITPTHSSLKGTGFSVDLGRRIKCLPVDNELEFNVLFDPASVNCQLGYTETILSLQLMSGPVYPVKLTAHVTLPYMELSSQSIDFGTARCGQCRIVSLRLHNPLQVKCEWNVVTEKVVKKLPKHTPLHIKKKMKEKPVPQYFEIEPTGGILLPEQKLDIQVKFMPSEDRHYGEKIPFTIHQNPDANLFLSVEGQGSEPHLIFDKHMIEFLSILPFSNGSDIEVTVSNPMDYPIEVYSLEFDKEYLIEEEALRWVKGYDKRNRLYLPPVEVGKGLPHEIMDAFKKEQQQTAVNSKPLSDQQQSLYDDIIPDGSSALSVSGGPENSESKIVEFQSPHPSSTALLPQATSISVFSNATGGSLYSELQLEGLDPSPVTTCIARYLGVDISPEAALTEMRKGIALIIHGPPYSGKTTHCKALCKEYDLPVLTLDSLIIDSISSAATPAGCRARELVMEATREIKEEEIVQETPIASRVSVAPAPPQRKPSKLLNSTTAKDPGQPMEPARRDPPKPFKVSLLLDTEYAVNDGILYTTHLPEEVIIDILGERLLQADCRKGLVFDGIECMFTPDELVSTALLLKAFQNRKYIYFVELDLDLESVRGRIVAMENEKKRIQEEEETRKRLERERIDALLNMSEDEYESLPVYKRKEIDNIRHQRYLNKRKERAEKQRKEKERLECERKEEEQRQEEEKAKGKKGGVHRNVPKASPATAAATDHIKQSPAHASGSRPESAVQPLPLGGQPGISTASIVSSNTDSQVGSRKKGGGRSQMKDHKGDTEESDNDEIKKRYNIYESSKSGIKTILENWDRVKGIVRQKKITPPTIPETDERTSKVTTPKKKVRKAGAPSAPPPPVPPTDPLPPEENEDREGVGVPLIIPSANHNIDEVKIDINTEIPSVNEILEGLGLGPEGNPIPDPVTFQVYHYPLKRKPVQESLLEHFVFRETSELSFIGEEVSKASLDHVTVGGGGGGGEDSRDFSPDASMRKRSGSNKDEINNRKRSVKSRQTKGSTPSPQLEEQNTASEEMIEQDNIKLEKHRWVIPPKTDYKLKLLFTSEEEGRFDQTLNFELVGTRRQYQLYCRGLCQLPTISREPRIVFPHRKRYLKQSEIISKRFILEKEEFHFGPLHCGKPRERYREGRYPENMEHITISNCSSSETVISFCFRNDINAATFLLDPPEMSLPPGESKSLTMWAYPKSPGEFKDQIVCSILHNPNPILFTICCDGVEPELKVDKKLLDFGKVLLHRKESRVLHLRNNTLLPAAWKLSGTETLGEEFSFSQEQGIVQPKSEFPLNVHFRAMKTASSSSKKAFKIEISDVAQIIGLMHVENIHLQAEAYDVALDISFPKGTDGGLDFGCLRVHDELRLTMQVKNRGKYDIAYNFSFDANLEGPPTYFKWFLVNPLNSVLVPGEKSHTVSVTFKPDRELTIRDQPILKCQVIDTHLGEHGEVIANIPISITARSVFSKYTITPTNDVNFGPIMISSRKSTTFTIENKGFYEFKYAVTKRLPVDVQKMRQMAPTASTAPKRAGGGGGGGGGKGELASASRSSSVASRLNMKTKDTGSLRYEIMGGATQRLVMGMFTVVPAMGVVNPGQSQSITVDCIAERQGKYDELLSIEISDSNRHDMPLHYKICTEVFVPSINNSDIPSIFEEHRICRQLGILGIHEFHEEGCVGVYGENDKKFIFKSVIVGSQSKARFKITNPNKVPCEINIATKSPSSSISSKQKGILEAFEVTPNRVALSPHSHVYATVTFKPHTMQIYNSMFEVSVDGPSQAKGKGLIFELQGEGNLPQISIIKPRTRSAQGECLMLFKKLLLGEKEIRPILLQNIGNIPATVTLRLPEEVMNIFELYELSQDIEDDDHLIPASSPLCISLIEGQTKEIRVAFQPKDVTQYRGTLQLIIKDNQFESMSILMVGEGYKSDVMLSNIKRRASERFIEVELLSDGNDAHRESDLYFGVCPVEEPAYLTFSLNNLSQTDPIRFQWPISPCLSFSPSVGHVHPCSSREITATFMAVKPKKFQQQRFAGKFWKIVYSKPFSQVNEWDDLMKSIKWVNVPQQTPGTNTNTTNTGSGSRPSSSSKFKGGTTTATATTTVNDESTTAEDIKLPLKTKVVETEAEPEHKLLDKNAEDLEVFLTAETAFADYDCPSQFVTFNNTYVLQSKVYTFPLKNKGKIILSYKWYLLHEVPDGSEELKEYGTKDESNEILIQIDPLTGEIPPGQEQCITVRYSPVTVGNIFYKFRCKMSHLPFTSSPLDLVVKGDSMVPYCHFDLTESDYLLTRRPSKVTGKGSYTGRVDQGTKVIEFTTKGTGAKVERSFNVINPTDKCYEFQWRQREGPSQLIPVFTCHTIKGTVPGGKKHEIKFEYISTASEYIEALWEFSIPALSITIPFLLVGHVLEPSVNLDRAYLSFRSMLIGSTSREVVYLISNEDIPYQFTISEDSCKSDDHRAKLKVTPLSGTILPNSKLPLEVSFTAVDEREFIFHLSCIIKKKPTPLSLNVKAEVYAINMALSVTDPLGIESPLSLDKNTNRIVDFQKVPINDRALWKLNITNSSLFPLHYDWKLSPNCNKKGGAEDKLIRVTPINGIVSAHTKSTSELVFSPLAPSVLKNCQLLLQISNGPSFPITLKGTGVEPNVIFNFTEYNFGPRFLHHPNMPLNITTLTITNRDTIELSVDCLYINTPHLELMFEPHVLAPDETMDIDCYFRPQQAIKYSEMIEFEINGICKKSVNITGQGAVVKVESVQKVVNLGALLVKDKSLKKTKLINKSPLAVTFTVNIVPSAQVPALQERGVISVAFCPVRGQVLGQDKEITLQPKEEIVVEVSFCPRLRVPQFTEEVIMESHGLSYPLFVVRGSCQGLEISLDNTHVPFGAVVSNSKSSRRILMYNSGDIGARFHWDTDKFAPDFSIHPTGGYISPGMEVPFDIVFHPQRVHNDIRYDNLSCHIEGGRPLKITLSGVCIDQIPHREVLHFSTNVRSKETKQITINNKTSIPWLLNPVIDGGEYWSGPLSLNVEAGHSAQYELTYHPNVMTKDSQKHQGSIFFPLPDGTGILYNLSGTSEAPKNTGSIVQDIPCKTSHIESLTVQNWLRQPQRFRAYVEMIRPEKLDRSVTIYGAEYIDVPAKGRREYKIHFYSFKEGSFLLKITFINEQSGEYLFYHVHFKSVPSGIISSIDLTTPVRQSISHTITIDNPFPSPINMTTSVNVSDISIPGTFLIGAESQGKCTFEYLPLKVDETVGKLVLQCNELGSYHYELHLKATPPAPEKPVHFTTVLGGVQTLHCPFTSYSRGRVEYNFKIDNPDFHVDKTITVAGVDVTYEPSVLGDTHATVTITSSAGGDFIIPLYGHCMEPKPQGPFSIKAGTSITIPFRNVFHQTTQFSFLLDNPAFTIKASDNMKPRKVHNITVYYDAKQADPNVVKLGKLVISCKNSYSNLRWTYYLKGLALDK